ncbi:MAG: photosynthetic complex putative assembly protein PuhB [Pseudomonadota bacterium]
MPRDAAQKIDFSGLPGRLPEGEEVLWQGRPNTWALACHAMMLKWVAAYFLLIAVWRAGSLMDLVPFWAAISAGVPFLVSGLIACAILLLFAHIQARATVYTVTSSRVVLKIGAALGLTVNLPYRDIDNAALDLRGGGIGTIALEMSRKQRLPYFACWPHVRPWRFNPTQPALRCIPDAERVAGLLSGAAADRVGHAVSDQPEFAGAGTAPIAAE